MNAYQKWISFYTIVRKDVLRMFRIWVQTFLPSAVTSILYFLIFGSFLGSQIGTIDGASYISFVIPGLVMLAVVTNSFANTSFIMFAGKFFGRSIDEILVSPTPSWLLVCGYVAGGMVRGILVGILVLLISLFFSHISIHNMFIIVLFLVLTSAIFSLAGLATGVYAKSIDGINLIPTFVLTPLVYLGGVFYSTSFLSPFWQAVTHLNPIFYIVNGFRYGFLGISDVSMVINGGVLVGLTLLLLFFTVYLVQTGLGLKK